MNISSKLLVLSAFAMATLCFESSGGKKVSVNRGNDDSLIKQCDNYIQYVNGIAAHGTRFMKVYVKIAGHQKFRLMTYSGYWPDSIQQTVNLVFFEGKPAEYSETPVSTIGGTNIEYDNYFFKGKLIAYRVFEVLNNNVCANGTVTNTLTTYYDSTGAAMKTIHTLVDANNNAIDPANCKLMAADSPHVYRSYSQTPLAKDGVER